jgi:predicted MFS family arabinose efflux permease
MSITQASRANFAALAAVFLVGIAAVMVAGLKPMLVTLYITKLQLSTSVAGFSLATEMLAATVGAAAVSLLLTRLSGRRLALVALVAMLSCDLISMLPLGLPEFIVVRLVAGFSAGLAASTIAATIAGMRAPDRLMGAYNAIALLVLAAAFAAAPPLTSRWGISALFLGLAMTTLPALLLNPCFPERGGSQSHGSSPVALPPLNRRSATFALLGTACFYFGLGGLWPYMGEIGRHSGLSTERVAGILSIAQLSAAAGSFVPVVLGQRAGRLLPVTIAVGLTFISIVSLLAQFGSASVFAWAAPVFLGGAMLLFGYLMGIIAGVDPSGRISSLSFSIQTISLGLGPAWAGMLATRAGYSAVLWIAAAVIPLSLVFLLPLAHEQDGRRRAANEAAARTIVEQH